MSKNALAAEASAKAAALATLCVVTRRGILSQGRLLLYKKIAPGISRMT